MLVGRLGVSEALVGVGGSDFYNILYYMYVILYYIISYYIILQLYCIVLYYHAVVYFIGYDAGAGAGRDDVPGAPVLQELHFGGQYNTL